MKNKRFWSFLIFVLVGILLVGIIYSIANKEHQPSEILLTIDGYEMTLQEAVNNGFLSGSSPSQDYTTEADLIAGGVAYHTGDEIYVSVDGSEGTLNSLAGSGLCSSGASSYSGVVVVGHSGDEVYVGAKTLQDAINDGDYCSPWANYDVNEFSYVTISDEDLEYGGESNNIFISPDEKYLYVTNEGNNYQYQYEMMTPGDITTLALINIHLENEVGKEPNAIFFNTDGTKMFIGQKGEPDYLSQFSLSTPWMIGDDSISYIGREDLGELVPEDMRGIVSVFFTSDGLKMYSLDEKGFIYEFSMSTAWDITTLTYVQSKQFPVGKTDQYYQFVISPDGKRLDALNKDDRKVYQFSMSTAWDISTLDYDSKFLDISARVSEGQGFFYNYRQTKMYVNEYDFSITQWVV